jgi:chromosome segregation ATPase
MNKKAKLIILILSALTIISGAFAFQINNSKEALVRRYNKEIDELSARNEELTQQLSMTKRDKEQIQAQLESLRSDIEGLTAQREEWQRKYEIISSEKDQLLDKIAELSDKLAKKPEVSAAPVVQPDVTAGLTASKEEGYWANVLKEKAAFEMKLKTLNDELANMKLAFDEAKKEKESLELQLSKLTQQKDDLERKVEYNETLADNLSNELARELNDKQFLLEQFNKIKQENGSLRTQIKELSMTKLSLEKSLKKLQDEKANIDKRIAETEQILQNRIGDILQLKQELEGAKLGKTDFSKSTSQSVELPPIIVRAQTEGSKVEVSGQREGKQGRIVSINPENNFVVIDMGQNSGVQLKDRFNVYRGAKQVATIEVIQLRKDIAAADIVKTYGKIEVGDIVR